VCEKCNLNSGYEKCILNFNKKIRVISARNAVPIACVPKVARESNLLGSQAYLMRRHILILKSLQVKFINKIVYKIIVVCILFC
jgi:hypothetical protein